MELHVALSLRLDAIEAHRLANAYRAEVLHEAADFVGNDDDCDCGGCDTCLPRKLADGLRKMAGTPRDSDALTTVEAYDGELAMLRGLVRTLRVAARQSDLPAVQQALINHATDDAAAREENTPADKRRADLLTAIRAHGGRWKSGRAVRVLRLLGHHPVSPKTAASDLLQLADAGHLVRHEEKGVRWYSVARRAGGERRG
jgi:hypothetical protein